MEFQKISDESIEKMTDEELNLFILDLNKRISEAQEEEQHLKEEYAELLIELEKQNQERDKVKIIEIQERISKLTSKFL